MMSLHVTNYSGKTDPSEIGIIYIIRKQQNSQGILANHVFCFWVTIQRFYLTIFTAIYGSHSQSKNSLYFPNFIYFST